MSEAVQRIVLVGLPGAGKSSVGRRAVEMLNARVDAEPWSFVDADAEIERRAGRSIPQIFARQGEAAFRKLERAVSEEWLGRERMILAPGGGWIELGDVVERFRTRSLFVFLQVSPAVAAQRIERQGGGRPLLEGGDLQQKLTELLARRRYLYVQSQHTLSVDSMGVDGVASYIVALASGQNGD